MFSVKASLHFVFILSFTSNSARLGNLLEKDILY